MSDFKALSVVEQSTQLTQKLYDQKQVLISGYDELLLILQRPGNISKQEISKCITDTLQKHNEI